MLHHSLTLSSIAVFFSPFSHSLQKHTLIPIWISCSHPLLLLRLNLCLVKRGKKRTRSLFTCQAISSSPHPLGSKIVPHSILHPFIASHAVVFPTRRSGNRGLQGVATVLSLSRVDTSERTGVHELRCPSIALTVVQVLESLDIGTDVVSAENPL